ncbi:hypothetical protein ACFQS1_39565 [Paractinoplanes rhizophilus]|uniref:Nucleotidyltransferase n=1 Tax=Paractinoplanes rhizophilus TaxID=1416877 RepID=A0ABW2I5G6_9ACTN
MKIKDVIQEAVDRISPSGSQHDKANRRAAVFTSSMQKMLHGKTEVVRSGSWARGTSLDPIHDVDLIVLLPSDLHAEYQAGSGSADAVLKYVAELIVEAVPGVHRAVPRNHVVKCYVDSRWATDTEGWHGFAVDVMPAFRVGPGVIEVPERRSDRWRTVAPENLIAASLRREKEWPEYLNMVRLLKNWAHEHPELGITSLAMEVLALRCLPHPPLLRRMSEIDALTRFFTAAAGEIMRGVYDPAGRSGEIAPGLDRRAARKMFLKMADLSATAAEWAKSGHPDGEDIAVHFLREIFGDAIRKPKHNWTQEEIDARNRPEPVKILPEERTWRYFPGRYPGQGPTPGTNPGDTPNGRPPEPTDPPEPPPGPYGPTGGPTPRPPGPADGSPYPKPRPHGPMGDSPNATPHPQGPTGGIDTTARRRGPTRRTDPTQGRRTPSPDPEATALGRGQDAGLNPAPHTTPPAYEHGSAAAGTSRFRNPAGHRAMLGAGAAVAAPTVVRAEDPAG